MKFILSILVVIAVSFSAQAQFVQPPSITKMVTNTGSWVIPGFLVAGGATNIPTTTAKVCPIGPSGSFGVFINCAGTNAITDTNIVVTLELIPNGTDKATNSTIAIVMKPPETYLPFFTNLVNTTANIGNCAAVRIQSVLNTNGTGNSVIITNISIITR